MRFNAPIFTYKNILDKAGIYLDNPSSTETNVENDDVLSNPETFGQDDKTQKEEGYSKLTIEELNLLLETAVQDEDYEKAAKIRDEISKREP